VQKVWFTEKENHRKRGMLCIGHTKCYIKVTVPFDESLLGTCALMKISECFRWHIEGEILEKDLKPEKADPLYFDNEKRLVLDKINNYKKKPKKLSDKTKDKLKELVDLNEESEDEAIAEENSISSEDKESETTTENDSKQSEEIPLKSEPKENETETSEPKSTSMLDPEFEDSLNSYKRAMRQMGSLSYLEYAALVFLFIAGMLHVFGI
jgi:hypothetical protein